MLVGEYVRSTSSANVTDIHEEDGRGLVTTRILVTSCPMFLVAWLAAAGCFGSDSVYISFGGQESSDKWLPSWLVLVTTLCKQFMKSKQAKESEDVNQLAGDQCTSYVCANATRR